MKTSKISVMGLKAGGLTDAQIMKLEMREKEMKMSNGMFFKDMKKVKLGGK